VCVADVFSGRPISLLRPYEYHFHNSDTLADALPASHCCASILSAGAGSRLRSQNNVRSLTEPAKVVVVSCPLSPLPSSTSASLGVQISTPRRRSLPAPLVRATPAEASRQCRKALRQSHWLLPSWRRSPSSSATCYVSFELQKLLTSRYEEKADSGCRQWALA